MQYQGMVVLAGNQVWWTWEVEDVFLKVKKGDKMAMKNYAKKCHSQIDDLVVKVRSNLSKNDRKKFNTVLIIEVHARDIVDGYVRDRFVLLIILMFVFCSYDVCFIHPIFHFISQYFRCSRVRMGKSVAVLLGAWPRRVDGPSVYGGVRLWL